MNKLFDQDCDDDDGKLQVNENYAGRYNRWREKEEFEKLKSKYGEDAALNLLGDSDDSSSTSESEDENGEGWTSDVEQDFCKTLVCLKKKDPSLYNPEQKFFSSEVVAPQKTRGKESTMFLRDYERKLVLEKGGKFSDEEDEGPSTSKTYTEEQNELKKDLKKILDDSVTDGDDLLTIRKKSKDEKMKEEGDYKVWLKGRKLEASGKDSKDKTDPLKEYWFDPKLDEGEKFLRDFFFNKRYLEEDNKDYVPTYDEIVHDSEGDLSEDERTLEKQTEFETKYNFRFEEPDQEFIKRYPRTIADSLRKTDAKRKTQRDQVKERKKQEKELKKEELKQLKKFKLNEIKEKLEQLKTITGNDNLPFQDEDFDEDFDPEKHDLKMQQLFNDESYQVNDGDQKPEFPYDPELDDENWDEYTGQDYGNDDDCEAGPSTSGYQPHCEDPDFNMDCDYDPREQSRKELIALSNNKREKSRRKSVFAQKLETKKPIFDPTLHPKYEEYLEEHYKLDYEDIIGDMPVRFKYRSVVANDFGLETEEILSARDKELNSWCSIKKTSQYRSEHEEMQDLHTFRTKGKNVNLKKKYLPSIFVENSEELLIEDQENARKKRRKNQGKEDNSDQPQSKKLRQLDVETEPSSSFTEPNETANESPPTANASDQVTISQNKKKKKKKKNQSTVGVSSTSEIKPVQSEKEPSDPLPLESEPNQSVANQKRKKKKNKKKKKTGATPTAPNAVPAPHSDKSQKKSLKNAKSDSNTAQAANQHQKKDYSLGMSDDRLKAYGFNPKKFKNQQKFGKSSKS